MLFLVIAASWLTLGLVAVAVMRHRGHDTFAWAIVFVFLGPLAIPLAVSSDRHPTPQPIAASRDCSLELLGAHDGSAEAAAALDAAFKLLGPRITSRTLAAVVDLRSQFNSARARHPARDTDTARRLVRDMALLTNAPVDTIILFGEAQHALQNFAAEHGIELIATSARSAGPSHFTGRRAAWWLIGESPVPVLVGPASR